MDHPTSDHLESLRRQRDRAEARLESLERQMDEERARLRNPRIVQVSYVNAHRIDLGVRWDYIDGIGNLRVGDRVITPRFHYPDCEGVVVAVDEPPRWHGRLKTIKARV